MMIDGCTSGLFEASSDKTSSSYFKLSYNSIIDGWQIDYTGPADQIIETKEVNFSNYYTKFDELKANEEISIFPPRFKFQVRSIGHSRTQLRTKFNVGLYNKKKMHKPDKDIILNLFVPAPATMKDCSIAHSIGEHDCDCQSNKVELIHLIKFSEKIAPSTKIFTDNFVPPEQFFPDQNSSDRSTTSRKGPDQANFFLEPLST